MHHRPTRRALAASIVVLAGLGLAACGGDDDSATATTAQAVTTTTHRDATTTTKRETTTTTGGGSATTSGGGGMHAGAPQFLTFDVSASVPCQSGNASVTMAYTTINVVSVAIKIGDGKFESTAGYNPNETHAVAEIPCSGAGTSSVQLRGCTEDNECADSPQRAVTITA